VACSTISCSGTDDNAVGKMTENLEIGLLIVMNGWVILADLSCHHIDQTVEHSDPKTLFWIYQT